MKSVAVSLALFVFFLPTSAHAIVPPDLLFSVGAQFAQFFSFIAFVVGGVFMSMAVGLSPYIAWVRARLCLVIGGLALTSVVAMGVINYLQYQQNEQAYQTRIAELEEQLVPVTRVASASTSEELLPVTDTSTKGNGAQFRSDTLFFYATGTDQLYVEVDLNRKQSPNGTYLHYYYLHARVAEKDIVEYVTFTSSSSVPQAKDFVRSLTQSQAADASTRRAYAGSIVLDGNIFTFSTDTFEGDFITKDSPNYTRLQSIEEAAVSYISATRTVAVMQEAVYAEDYREAIFFPSQRELEAITHQFVLWDEVGNFYLLDNSEVFSDTPAYPSHTWLLYKESETDLKDKSFTAEITRQAIMGVWDPWQISMPEFGEANVFLRPVHTIDHNNLQSRDRTLVTGTINDESGSRTISGFLHYIDR